MVSVSQYEVVNVRAQFGATGDGSDDTSKIQAAIDYCFGAKGNAADRTLNKTLYFPPGIYKTTKTLHFEQLGGAKVIGDGRFTTIIKCTTENIAVFETNGAGRCHFEGFTIEASVGGTCFDLDWLGPKKSPNGGHALQANRFVDMEFDFGSHGVKIGKSGFMGSENIFENCFWQSNTTAGIMPLASNALQNTVIGGNFQGCGRGIFVACGSVPNVIGVGFQQSVSCDIDVQWGANSTMNITGCRSESTNFINNLSQPSTVINCTHYSGTSKNGYFVHTSKPTTIDCCVSTHGRVESQYPANIVVQNSTFNRSDWISIPVGEVWWKPNNPYSTSIYAINVRAGTEPETITGRRYFSKDGKTIQSVECFAGGTRLINDAVSRPAYGHDFDRTAMYTLVLDDICSTVEVDDNSDSDVVIPLNSSVAFPIGTRIEVRQIGAGTVTVEPEDGVTLNGAGTGIPLVQYGGCKLIKRGSDSWIADYPGLW